MVDSINSGSVQAPYWEQTITLKPHERRKIEYVTDNFQLLNTSVPNALCVNFGGSMIDTPFRAGMGYRLTEPVQFVEIWNDNNVELTVDFVLGIGQIQDNRLTLIGQVDTKTTPQGFTDIQIGSRTLENGISTTLHVGANQRIAVMCTSGELRLGNNPNYMILKAGQSFEFDSASSIAFNAVNLSGSPVTFNLFIGSY